MVMFVPIWRKLGHVGGREGRGSSWVVGFEFMIW